MRARIARSWKPMRTARRGSDTAQRRGVAVVDASERRFRASDVAIIGAGGAEARVVHAQAAIHVLLQIHVEALVRDRLGHEAENIGAQIGVHVALAGRIRERRGEDSAPSRRRRPRDAP